MINTDEIEHNGARGALVREYQKALEHIEEAAKHQHMSDAPEILTGIQETLADARALYVAWEEMGEYFD